MIRNATQNDIDFIFGLYMHPEINPFLLYEPMDKRDFQPIFDELLAQNILYVFTTEVEPQGMFKLIPLKHRTSHIAYLGGVALSPACFGKGLAQQMFADIFDLAREKQVKRIELSVATHNERAIRLYQNAGFETEGILKKYTYLAQEQRYLDEQLMARLL
ncbi:GNAT family N-acetyltransferase [Undibacterium sp. LX40W]|uniref:GNAT family N-acetyltransferase n=1 Tax=Undibacterium nitidum TaxID=2762298 RepID=A0A923KUF6_9BURK|nr:MULTISPECIES: GNAT family N-acetyltransferase [Undibacterium]MBC3882644.1 GNAT family N-acetyltransferase [Undibacterium nitidum]MBC3892925.1 GNAT family N-acetyltransferase [Undibacterium sp. LX40W]